jgi:magnesium transporter
MNIFRNKKKFNIGLPPGTIVEPQYKSKEKVTLDLYKYNKSCAEVFKDLSFAEFEKLYQKNDDFCYWLNVSSISDLELIQKLGEKFNLDSLSLEDLLNVDQRAKAEEWENYFYTCLKMVYSNKQNLIAEQLNIFFNKNILITFQEREGDIFDPIRKRIMLNQGKVRAKSINYLFYCLFDLISDSLYNLVISFEDELENLSFKIDENPEQQHFTSLQSLKKQILFFKKYIYQLKEVLSIIQKTDTKYLKPNIDPFWRDLDDHLNDIKEAVESLKELYGSTYDQYYSILNTRMNETMKVLTLSATIFIPLTFICGIYGMNFSYMPELQWKYSYFVLWGLFITITVSLLLYFRSKKWL